MRRSVGVAVVVALACLVASRETRAGDGKPAAKAPPKPAEPVVTETLPPRLVRERPTIDALKIGESARIPPICLGVSPDGTAWVNVKTYQQRAGDYDPASSPKVVKTGEREFDVDLTGCDTRWTLVGPDGAAFAATADHARVRQFLRDGEKSTPTLPESARGEPLWSIPPDTTVFVSARAVGVESRGVAWVDARAACRRERFVDGCGPAVAATASDHDVVKLDLTGVTWRWRVDDYPEVRPFNDTGGLNGHKSEPFGVSSCTRDGAVSPRMPRECVEPILKDLKPGKGGYVDVFRVCVDSRGTAWVDDSTPVSDMQRANDYEFADVKVVVVDPLTCTLDLSGTTCRWSVATTSGARFSDTTEHDGNLAFGCKWLRVVEVLDKGASLGTTLPERSRCVRLFELPPGSQAYESARFLHVDTERHGFVSGSAPVCRAPFEDDLGPSVAILLGADDATCAADLRGVTAKWDLVKAPAFEAVEHPVKGGPRQRWLKVVSFTTDPPPAPPPSTKPAKPTKK